MLCFLDAFEGAREACFLCELFCRRPVLTDPVPSPRRALRPDAPVVCSILGHPWDEKGLQRQEGVGVLVSIQE